jgi:hypothetical protein
MIDDDDESDRPTLAELEREAMEDEADRTGIDIDDLIEAKNDERDEAETLRDSHLW